jgi:hypothetical protein
MKNQKRTSRRMIGRNEKMMLPSSDGVGFSSLKPLGGGFSSRSRTISGPRAPI